MYFYKKTDKAIICTTETLATKTVKLKNGKEIQCRVQVADLKFGVLAVSDQDVGDLKVGDELPFKITDSQVMDAEGNPTTLYWCTPE